MKKSRRILSFILCITLVLSSLTTTAFARSSDPSFYNFTVVNWPFSEDTFSDINSSDWFYSNVEYVYMYGLMNGSNGKFDPNGNVTIAQTITVAARLHSIYNTGEDNFEQGSPWYQTYVDYAKENGIISSDYPNYNKAATRAEYATILAAALPDDALPAISDVADGIIPDVSADASYYDAVYKLYRAGVLTGSDEKGSFAPDSSISRREVSAVVSRMGNKYIRQAYVLDETGKQTKEDPRSGLRFVLTWDDPSIKLGFNMGIESSADGGYYTGGTGENAGFAIQEEPCKVVYSVADIALQNREQIATYYVDVVEENFDTINIPFKVQVFRGDELLKTYESAEGSSDWYSICRYDVDESLFKAEIGGVEITDASTK